MEKRHEGFFTAGYWRAARAELKSVRSLALAGLMCALVLILGKFRIPVGENLNIYFTYLVKSVGAAVYGPLVAMLAAAVSDTLGFVLDSGGFPYFPGYMLGEMVSGLLFAAFLYRQRITVARLALAKLLVNALVNVGLGCLWSSMLYGKGYYYFLATSLPKNALLLPAEVLLMALTFAAVLPSLARAGLVAPQPAAPGRRLPLPLF